MSAKQGHGTETLYDLTKVKKKRVKAGEKIKGDAPQGSRVTNEKRV